MNSIHVLLWALEKYVFDVFELIKKRQTEQPGIGENASNTIY